MDSNLMGFATYIVEKIRRGRYGMGLIRSTTTKKADNEVMIELIDYSTDIEITIKSNDFGPVHR